MEFKIGSRKIGIEQTPLVIAEIGINHEGSIDLAKELVLSAKKAGCEVIKHQTHIVEDEMSIEAKSVIPSHTKNSIYDIMEKCSLSEDEEYELMNYTKSLGLTFISTPFSRSALYRLIDFDVPAIKIGSGECNNYPLLKEVARFGKPVILSTGMSDIEIVRKAVKIFNSFGCPLALMHTTNIYPTPNHLVRLGAINHLMQEFPMKPIGLSDHTTTNHSSFGAIALGASIIEKHYIDDRRIRTGPDVSCSMNEKECKELIQGARILFEQRGGRKTKIPEEQNTRDFAYASVCSIEKILKGEKFTKNNTWVRRPGTGDFSAEKYDYVLGKIAAIDIEPNITLKKEHIKLNGPF